MIFFTQMESGVIDIKKGMFISTEMSRRLADEINSGNVSLSANLIPVHPPWDGVYKVDLGDNDNLRVDEKDWADAGLPYIYKGENLENKQIVIFPMHGLGDQLYLAVALRNLALLYPSVTIHVVRPAIESSDQWYSYIYFDDFFRITGPVVSADEMTDYDYYVNAEHFAHIDDYEGTYPPEFYMKYFFYHEGDLTGSIRPSISPCQIENVENKTGIDNLLMQLKSSDKTVVFVSIMTTGRVRDILSGTVMSFIEIAKNDYSFVISTYNNKSLDYEIKNMNLQDVVTTNGYINNIDELIYMLGKTDYVITSDSGITHLAEALETPCGSVFNVVTPYERTKPYKFSEQMMIEFEIPGVCKTPCYCHALSETEECAGMKWKNKTEGTTGIRTHAPCMENFTGEHLMMLLDALVVKFNIKNMAPETSELDRIIENNVFRKDVYDSVPEGASKILDFGCHQGELLLRLRRDKECTELYGVEIHNEFTDIYDKYLDGHWLLDLGEEENELESDYHNYFNYIIMHDVVEHLYDPWYVVEKLRQYLSPQGKMVIVVPNIQYWGILDQIMQGNFPYGGGGLLNEDHIRWFTCSSIIELAMMAGYNIDYFLPLFPPGTELSGYADNSVKTALRFPPEENPGNGNCRIEMNFSDDLKKNYYLFLANKILLVCSNSDKPVDLKKLTVGGLQKRKEALGIDFKCELG